VVYNASSHATSLKVGASGANQITENYTFNSQTGLLDNQTIVRGSSTTLLNLSYNYAGANGKRSGQLVSISNNLDHNKDRAYEYDGLGRLKRATGGQNINWAQRYVYDRYGNRTHALSYTAEQYVRNFYQSALNRQPTTTELNGHLSTLQTAYTQGASQFLTAMRAIGVTVFTSSEYNEPDNREFVKDLYRAFLFRESDQSGEECGTNKRTE
jgi:YD repeat-containing protein